MSIEEVASELLQFYIVADWSIEQWGLGPIKKLISATDTQTRVQDEATFIAAFTRT